LPLGDPQHFCDGAIYNFPVGLCGLSSVSHCSLMRNRERSG
jgi:hypothetical protein